MEDAASRARFLKTELDAVGALERPSADRASAILLREEAAALVGRHGSAADVLGSVRLAEDAALGGRLGAPLALAPRTPAEAVVRLVESDPLAVLPRLALAGRKYG
jgi:hypothetical protein